MNTITQPATAVHSIYPGERIQLLPIEVVWLAERFASDSSCSHLTAPAPREEEEFSLSLSPNGAGRTRTPRRAALRMQSD